MITLHAQDFAYHVQENRTKHYRKFMYFGFDFRFYSFFLILLTDDSDEDQLIDNKTKTSRFLPHNEIE